MLSPVIGNWLWLANYHVGIPGSESHAQSNVDAFYKRSEQYAKMVWPTS